MFDFSFGKCMFNINFGSSKKKKKLQQRIFDSSNRIRNCNNINDPNIMIELIMKELLLVSNAMYAFCNVFKYDEKGTVFIENVCVLNLDVNKTFYTKGFMTIVVKSCGKSIGIIGLGETREINGLFNPLIDLTIPYLESITNIV